MATLNQPLEQSLERAAHSYRFHRQTGVAIGLLFALACRLSAEDLPVVKVEGQPLAANARRLIQAFDLLGTPLPAELAAKVETAAKTSDARELQKLLDPRVFCSISINPEYRVKVARGSAPAVLTQAGFTPVLIKVHNEGTVTERLRIGSPQSGPVYAGAARFSLERQQQTSLADNQNDKNDPQRFLEVELFASPPMTERLSGLEVEYVIALLYSRDAGKREATLGFDIGQGTQDLGFRADLPVLFQVRPAVPIKLKILDEEGAPSVARLEIRDPAERVFPPQPKRLAPDFFFQPQIYRRDGDVLLLPPGKFEVLSSRGPEYKVLKRTLVVPEPSAPDKQIQSPQEPIKPLEFTVPLERWVAPLKYGFYGGDHHIHAAGCAHYQVPTEGVGPADMLLQVKGEGLNVGCILNWGYCYEHQRAFFGPQADKLSEPLTVLKYDIEVSGFGSAAMGHVCLINLNEQTYPGSEGTIKKGWPTWTVPVLKWAKEQGGITGYPHSDMRVDPPAAAKRMLAATDADKDGRMTPAEASAALLPESFKSLDRDGDMSVSEIELSAGMDRAADELPNLVLPSMNGSGAMEILVSTPAGVCDFISAMDTGRVGEWNTWYHLLNCGFPLKVSGETDFPCMSSLRVGQGRVYVQLGNVERLDFHDWCLALVKGRSYVSDGYAHALQFTVNGQAPGFDDLALNEPGIVEVRAKVAFSSETPQTVAQGTSQPPDGRREVGDTRILHGTRGKEIEQGGMRLVELVANGRVIARKEIPADGREHDLTFQVQAQRSCWLALRQFPQLHTNPVNVIVARHPLLVSKQSARWCREGVELLWEKRHQQISQSERPAARTAYDAAIAKYKEIADQAINDTAVGPAAVAK